MLRRFSLLLSFIALSLSYIFSQGSRSILADGVLYKVEVKQTGLYRLSSQDLVDMGIDLQNVNPRNIHLYGNGGGRLPEPNAVFRFDDLVENAIVIEGQSDGSFDNGDALLFYGEGPDVWYHDGAGKWAWDENPYAESNYYYLKIMDDPGRRIASNAVGPAGATPLVYVQRCQHYEEDRTNLMGDFPLTEGTGQQWFGDYFNSERTKSFGNQFQMSGLNESVPIEVEALLAARSKSSSRLELSVNDNRMVRNVSAVSGSSTGSYATTVRFEEELEGTAEGIDIEINYPSNGTISEAWLDYITVRSEHELSAISAGQHFFLQETDDTHTIPSAFSDRFVVWDVTAHHDIKVANEAVKTDMPRKLFVWDDNGPFLSPVTTQVVANQNLHGITDIDMIVVYAEEFETEVERFVEHRTAESGLLIEMVTVQQIAEEFGSGKKDPVAIRDFARYVYKRSEGRLQYLLLFGDASYDYRHIDQSHSDQNFVPTYQTRGSLHPISNFPSDDFFALLDDSEGGNLVGAIDISVGRIPVKSTQEARAVVDKIIEYDGPTFGDWRVRHTWVADDEDSNTHFRQSENVVKDVASRYEDFNASKIYLDAYEQVSTPGGERYPDASAALDQAFFKGHLLVNYLGHGGPLGWAQERVLQLNDIQQWSNPGKYPLMVTATCTFTGYDDPAIVSGGEASFLRDGAGVIGLFTTTRAVLAHSNERLVLSVMDTLYSKRDGQAQRFGDVLRIGKNSRSQDTLNINARKFTLIGDPSQQLALPEHDIAITSINGVDLRSDTPSVKALEKVEVKAEIIDGVTGEQLSFDGQATITVYDKPSRLRLLNNDPGSNPGQFDVLSNILYRGSAEVIDGVIEFSFVVPSDINYELGQGKISIYAHNEVTDAAGATSELLIGGGSSAVSDDRGPEIQLYMNDRSFIDRGLTSANPLLIVDLQDDLGINVTGNSIGHDLVATLEGPVQGVYNLNDFYQASAGNFADGTATFPLKDLDVGEYIVTVKAWDVANNSNEAQLRFRVTAGDGLEIIDVYNAPNPFIDETTITFKHNLSGYQVEVEALVYDMVGRLHGQYTDATTLSGSEESFTILKEDLNLQLGGGNALSETMILPVIINVTIPELDNLTLRKSVQMLLTH